MSLYPRKLVFSLLSMWRLKTLLPDFLLLASNLPAHRGVQQNWRMPGAQYTLRRIQLVYKTSVTVSPSPVQGRWLSAGRIYIRVLICVTPTSARLSWDTGSNGRGIWKETRLPWCALWILYIRNTLLFHGCFGVSVTSLGTVESGWCSGCGGFFCCWSLEY